MLREIVFVPKNTGATIHNQKSGMFRWQQKEREREKKKDQRVKIGNKSVKVKELKV